MLKKIFLIGLILILCLGAVSATSIIDDFEDGDATGWTVVSGATSIVNATTMEGNYHINVSGNGQTRQHFAEDYLIDLNVMMRTNAVGGSNYFRITDSSNNILMVLSLRTGKFQYGTSFTDMAGTPANNTNYIARIVYRKATQKADVYFYSEAGALITSNTNVSATGGGATAYNIEFSSNQTMGIDYITSAYTDIGVDANYDYVIDPTNAELDLTDDSIVTGSTNINQWTYKLDDTNIYYSTSNGTYTYDIEQNTDYNIGIRVDTDNGLTDTFYRTISVGNWYVFTNDIIHSFDNANAELDLDVNASMTYGTITGYKWEIDGVTEALTKTHTYAITSNQDYNVCMTLTATGSDSATYTDTTCETITSPDLIPPVTTFESYQISGTKDQNITLACTDNNSGCASIFYNINNEGWKEIGASSGIAMLSDFEDGNWTGWTVIGAGTSIVNTTDMEGDYYLSTTGTATIETTGQITDVNFLFRTANIGQSTYVYLEDASDNIVATSALRTGKFQYQTPALYVDATNGSDPVSNTNYRGRIVYNKSTMTASYYWYTEAGALLNYAEDVNATTLNGATAVKLRISTNTTMGFDSLVTNSLISTGSDTYSFLYNGIGDHNILYYSVDADGSTETTNTDYFSTYGLAQFNFFDDTTEAGLNSVYLEFDGTPYYSDTNTTIIIDLNGITSGSKNLLMQVTGYQEKDFNLNFTDISDVNYNMGFVSSSTLSDVAFQVFTESGAIKANTSFMGYDNDNNFLIDVKTTNSVGKVNFYLNNTKSNYYFISTDLNFSTTTWTIKKPKDASTLADIVGNWKYSITGNSYSSATNIASDVTKILLQNTVNPYYIKIQDVNENYTVSNFGLQSVTSEKAKTLNPYLYPFGSASLVLIKLLDFSTNQPVSSFNELQLSLYTDSNGLIEIGTYINDSTGTYNIYMDQNEKYELVINDQTFILNPTLSIYYLYLTQASGLEPTNDVNTIVNDFNDLNTPAIFSEVREYFFGCSAEEDNCYNSMIFSLIFIVILAIGLSVYLTIGSLEQSILIFVLLAVFTFIGFIPVWLFAISAVVAFMWGVFS